MTYGEMAKVTLSRVEYERWCRTFDGIMYHDVLVPA